MDRPERPVVLPLHLRWTARSLSLSLRCQTKTFRNTLILSESKPPRFALRARKQVYMYTLERETEREIDVRRPENEKVKTRERLRERALPRCRDLTLRETKVYYYTVAFKIKQSNNQSINISKPSNRNASLGLLSPSTSPPFSFDFDFPAKIKRQTLKINCKDVTNFLFGDTFLSPPPSLATFGDTFSSPPPLFGDFW